MTSTSLVTVHGNDDAKSALPGVHVKRARSNGTTWLKIRFALGFYAWERVRMFPNAEECSIYRMELLQNAVSAGSRTKLEEVYRLHCVPAAKMAPPPAK